MLLMGIVLNKQPEEAARKASLCISPVWGCHSLIRYFLLDIANPLSSDVVV